VREVYCRASSKPRALGARLYQAAVAFRERAQIRKQGALIAVGKIATAAVSRFVRAN